MHDARARRVADIADDGTFRERGPAALHARRWALEMAKERRVIAQPAPLAQGVARHDGISEQLADEEDLRSPLLVLQLDHLDGCAAGCREIEAAMPDVRKFAAPTLLGFGQVEIVAAHGQVSLGHRDRIAVGVVGDGAIGPARYLVVRFEAPALVVVRAGQRGRLFAAERGAWRYRDAGVVVGKRQGWTERGDALRGDADLLADLRRHSNRRTNDGHVAGCSAAEEGEADGDDGRSIQWVHTDVEYDTSSPMGLSNRSGLENALAELFAAEKKARDLADEIADGPPELVLAVLTEAVERARKLADEPDRIARLESVAKILGSISGPAAVDALIDILGSEEHEARHTAGMVLEEIAFERFKEVALGVERALAKLPPDHLALSELPYILIEVPEPGVIKLVHRFLEHSSEEVAAAAIEACVELGDPSSVPKLAKLERDTRLVELDEEGEPDRNADASVTIGELAKEARLLLQSLEPEDSA